MNFKKFMIRVSENLLRKVIYALTNSFASISGWIKTSLYTDLEDCVRSKKGFKNVKMKTIGAEIGDQ